MKAVLKKLFKAALYFGLFVCLLAAGFYLRLATLDGKPAEPYDIFADADGPRRPLVIAHRGGAGLAPENTLEAFRRSLRSGADVLELDVRATKDGRLVVIHDRTVDRTTDGTGPVAEMTLEEIRRLDAGYRWTGDGGKTHPFRGRGIRIPTLREVFEEFPDARINIEAKHDAPSPVEPVCGLIREHERADRSIFASFHGGVLESFRRTCREVATSASPSESTWFLAMYELGLSRNFEAPMQALQIPRRIGGRQVVTDDFVRAARERNLQLHVWTINEVADMRRLIDAGVDGIMTDRPDRLLRLLEE